MAEVNTTMNYDEEEDILLLSRGRKVKASIDVGDFIIDVDTSGFINGIEILNSSQNLGLTENQLKDLKQASMNVSYKPNDVLITIAMQFGSTEKDIHIPLAVDLGHASVTSKKTNFAIA